MMPRFYDDQPSCGYLKRLFRLKWRLFGLEEIWDTEVAEGLDLPLQMIYMWYLMG